MPATLNDRRASAHRVIPEMRPAMAKADLRKPESVDYQAEIGACLNKARLMNDWTLEQLAAELKRDARQVARWIRGEENVQMDVVFAVPELREPFVIALAKLANCEVETVIRTRRTA
jgi:ribosome-binding protein aMBF1 (putative translation factor)